MYWFCFFLRRYINFTVIIVNELKELSLSLPRGSPLMSKNRLALDGVKSISALSAHSAVKGLIIKFGHEQCRVQCK